MRLAIFLLSGCLICSPATAQSVTWYVSATHGDDVAHTGTNGWDDAYATIIKAISSSSAGSVVLLSNDVYTLTSTLIVGDRRIMGFSGVPADTIVDGAGSMRCFVLDQPGSFISGLTITNGVATSAHIGGGGVTITNGGTVSNCWILGNRGTSTDGPNVHGGGGVFFMRNGGYLLNSLIAGNISSNDAGGIMARMVDGTLVVRDCVISNNTALRNAGGLFLYSVSVFEVEDCLIADNTAHGSGGGAYNLAGEGVLKNCIIRDNTALSIGGGIYINNAANCLTRNCLITGNQVTEGVGIAAGGGGVNIFNNGHMVNCTIVSNTANTNAGGIVYYSQLAGNAASVSNTIVCFNTANGVNSNWYAGNATHKHNVSFYNCCLMPTNGLPGSSAGNIAADPLFVDNAGDYRLQRASPCINAGLNQDWMSGAVDLEGGARIDRFSGLVDIGCYEYAPKGTLYYVR